MLFQWVYIIAVIATVLSNLVIMAISWSRRQTPAAKWFTLLLFALAILSFSYLMAAVVEDVAVAYTWVKIRYSMLTLGIVLFMFTVLAFTENSQWVRPPIIVSSCVIPSITIIIVWFFPEYFWHTWEIDQSTILNLETQYFAGWFVMHSIYAYALLIGGTGLLFRYALSSTSFTQNQALIFASGIAIVIVMSLLPTLGLTNNIPNPIPIALSILALHLFWALFKHGLFQLSSASYHNIVEHMQDMVIVLDPHDHIVMANQQAHLLFASASQTNIIGQHLSDVFVKNKLLPEKCANVWEANFELPLAVDGEAIILDASMSAILNERDQPKHKLLILRDITRRKEAERRELELKIQLERTLLLTRFIQNSAHEFRTPLAIIGTNNYLMINMDEPALRQEKADQITAQIDRITQLVDTQLLLAKVERMEFTLDTTVDMALLARQVQTEIQAKFGDTPSCEFSGAVNLPQIKGNAVYLTHALKQVLNNAYGHTLQTGSIKIHASQTDQSVCIEIMDDGVGITEDEMPYIFDTFWRRDTSHDTPGMGVGLTIAKRIIEAHQGKIIVESKPRQGTRVQMSFPVQQQ